MDVKASPRLEFLLLQRMASLRTPFSFAAISLTIVPSRTYSLYKKTLRAMSIHRLRLPAALFGALICCMSIAEAATFTALCDGEFEVASQECSIRLSGPIERGDDERLMAVLRQKPPPGWRYGTLVLDSPGGSVGTALQLSTIVRKAVLSTSTYRTGKKAASKLPSVDFTKCVSACFLVWVSGADRSTLAEQIGLHRPYLEREAYSRAPEKIAELHQKAIAVVSEHLRSEQIPTHLVEKMLNNASTQVYWIKDEYTSVNGRSAWYEETLIARCSFDPDYDQKMLRQIMQRRDGAQNADSEINKYINWRRNQYSCEYGIKEAAQSALRK